MTQTYRKTLLAGAIAALLATPMIASAEVARDGAQTTGTPQAEQQWRSDTTTDRSVTGDSANQPESSAQPQTKGADTRESTQSGLQDLEEPVGYPTEEHTKGADGERASDLGSADRSTGADMTMGADRTAGAQVSDNPLYSRSVDNLKGMDVVDSAGKEIGKLTGVVLSPDRQSAHAVISSGGFLGMGAREVLVPLSDLKSMDGQLQMDTTEQAFKERSEFLSDNHIRLDGDRPILESIVEAAPFEPGYGSDLRRDSQPSATGSDRGVSAPDRTTETR